MDAIVSINEAFDLGLNIDFALQPIHKPSKLGVVSTIAFRRPEFMVDDKVSKGRVRAFVVEAVLTIRQGVKQDAPGRSLLR